MSDKLGLAVSMATSIHGNQYRKTAKVPAMAHLLGVCELVLLDGGSETEAIAALLHDSVEDGGGVDFLDKIKNTFGGDVARIVDWCTDSYQTPKKAWIERKVDHVARLSSAPPDVCRVYAADKINNLTSLLEYLHEGGTFEVFNGNRLGTVWYYQAVYDSIQTRLTKRMESRYYKLLEGLRRRYGHTKEIIIAESPTTINNKK